MRRLTQFVLAAVVAASRRVIREGPLFLVLAIAGSSAAPAMADVTLDTHNPLANFEQDGNQTVTPGTALVLTDGSPADHIGFYAQDPDAASGMETEVSAAFRVVTNSAPAGVDAGLRIIITDGVTSAVAACVTLGGLPGIGIAIGTDFNSPGNYGAFVQVDWMAPVTIKLRRTAAGDAEIVEVNGAPPPVRTFVPAAGLPGAVRATPSVGFGLFSDPAVTTAEFNQFASRAIGAAVAGDLTFTRFRIHDTESSDKLALRGDFTLGSGSNGIDPATEPVTIKLSTAAGEFYAQTLNGFTAHGKAPRRRWMLNDSERARTGIERLVIDEDPNDTGGIFLRDVRTDAGTGDFSTVSAEIEIGAGSTADTLTGTAALMQEPAGSGKWRLSSEP